MTEKFDFFAINEKKDQWATASIFFDEDAGELMIHFTNPTSPAAVHYIDEHFGLLVQLDNNLVVGFQIEGIDLTKID